MSLSPAAPNASLSAVKLALLARELRAKLDGAQLAHAEPIAIVGLGCRFPGGAHTPEAFWHLLRDGVDTVTEVPASRWDVDAFYDPDPAAPGKVATRWGAFLDRVDEFDAAFFGITPREAESLDPQQRLLLEVGWEALEHAGQAPDRLAETQTGIFLSLINHDYLTFHLRAAGHEHIDAYYGTGNAASVAAGRLAYLLGLRGPAIAVDTACSSSLVAVHLACHSLRTGESDLALAGGVNLVLSPETGISFTKRGMLASDGRCKTFDARANGYVRGEGCGLVVLKRLSDALKDGDTILAVVRGSAVNQDGRTSGLTVPNGRAQQDVMRAALANAHIGPADLDYIEAHGTGTPVGDPIELQSIAAVVNDQNDGRPADRRCAVGSVKTNIGHLEAAAGIAGLIKVVLSLQHEEIPPHLHLETLNPYVTADQLHLDIPTQPRPWPAGERPRFAGVSSFAFSGTNAHVVLEEAPRLATPSNAADRPSHVLAVSAKSRPALRRQAERLAAHLEAQPQASLADVCFTANTGRAQFRHRLAVAGSSPTAIAERLRAAAADTDDQTPDAAPGAPKIVVLFTGQGAQYPDAGRGLYETQPTFRSALDRCGAILAEHLDVPLVELLYGSHDPRRLDETAVTQPLLFALEYAMAELWRAWGVRPAAVMGHSLGEYVAACVAGAFSLEDALGLVARRAKLMQSLPAGGEMAAVRTDEATLGPIIARYAGELSIAALNGPGNTVISGAAGPLGAVLDELAARGIAGQRLAVSHAFHSPLMEPILDEFASLVGGVSVAPIQVPLVSNLTGQMLAPGATLDAAYWRQHMRQPVRFGQSIATLLDGGQRIFLEVGPQPTLLNMARRCAPETAATALWLPSLRRGQDDWTTLLDTLGRLYTAQAPIDWVGFDRDYRRRRVALPTYPFEGRRYWVAAPAEGQETMAHVVASRTETFRTQLRAQMARLFHMDPAEVDPQQPFLEMGADSIVLIEAIRVIEKEFGVKLSIRLLFEEVTTIDALAAYLDQHVPAPESAVAPEPATTPAPIAAPVAPAPVAPAPSAAAPAAPAPTAGPAPTAAPAPVAAASTPVVPGPAVTSADPAPSAVPTATVSAPTAPTLATVPGAPVPAAAPPQPAPVAAASGAVPVESVTSVVAPMVPAVAPFAPASVPVMAPSAPAVPSPAMPVAPVAPLASAPVAASAAEQILLQQLGVLSHIMSQQLQALQGSVAASALPAAPAFPPQPAALAAPPTGVPTTAQGMPTAAAPVAAAPMAAPVAATTPAMVSPAPVAVSAPVAPATTASTAGPGMATPAMVPSAPSSGVPAPTPPTTPGMSTVAPGVPAAAPVAPASAPAAPAAPTSAASAAHGPYQPMAKQARGSGGFTGEQQAALARLTERYVARTATSKAMTQAARATLADPRASAGFRPSTKELLYPLVGQKAAGCRIWDVDGNEYIDISMDFGANLLGHGDPAIMAALRRQLDEGLALAPQSRLAGEVAQLFCELTGMERVAFCCSGTEAVMTALRLARTVTGRTKVALFSGSYHGHFDGLLARPADDDPLRSVPLAPGVGQHAVEDIIVLKYGDPAALETIRQCAGELAAVLVEPVQSRNPALQPREFLHALRALTLETGTPLIFDEMITGFRTHPGGAQAWFGVKADIATYGKIVGGGMPIGAIAGSARYLDAVDGGLWRYGDDSYPQAETTFVAGTFAKHPLAMAAAHAVLTRLKSEGPALQEQLTARTARLAQTLNEHFQQHSVPMRVVHFGSLFRFAFDGNMDQFFYRVREHGVHIWEGRNCFLSTAHSDADVDRVIQAVKDAVEDLRRDGFLPGVRPASLSPAPTPPPAPTAPAATPSSAPAAPAVSSSPVAPTAPSTRPLEMSLSFFGAYEPAYSGDKYRLLFDSARFADHAGFAAVWLPERHFHPFGGLSPNPSVLAAALARATERIHLRAGSVVMPLQHPIRVAEEWSVVDNLAPGRVGVAFASGWHPNDFALAPDAYADRRRLMVEGIQQVQQLWRGEPLHVRQGSGEMIDVALHPMPTRPELPIWLTSVSSPETFRQAGALGAGVLTNLMGQSLQELASNIAIYRQSLVEHGYRADQGHVTVLLHTLVGDDAERVRELARQPFNDYLVSSSNLFVSLARSQGLDERLASLGALGGRLAALPADERASLLGAIYERYVRTSALIGTPETCAPIVDNLRALGVDEIGCFIDFGVPVEDVLASLPHLAALRRRFEVPDTLPLTDAQRPLWISAQMSDAGLRAYTQTMVLDLKGALDTAAMRRAFQRVVDRHESLRTVIDDDGEVQRILPSLDLDVPLVDFSDVASTERQANVHLWLTEDAHVGFDLANGPLLRASILKLEDHHHLLVVNAHHLVHDGWSAGVVLEDLSAYYRAERQGTTCYLAPALQFRTYAAWRAAQDEAPERAADGQFWTNEFATPVPALQLPTDRARPATTSFRGDREVLTIDARTTDALKRFSKQQGSTLFISMLAGYSALLHRLTGQDDLVIGVPLADRQMEGSNTLCGHCTNVAPTRHRPTGARTFADHLRAVRTTVFDTFEHANYPLARLLEELRQRSGDRLPLIATTFNLDRSLPLPELDGLSYTLVDPVIRYSKFDVELNAAETPEGELRLELTYNSDLFDAASAARLLAHYQTLLCAVMEQPNTPLGQLPLLGDAERQQILVDWNATPAPLGDDAICIHHHIAEHAASAPDAVAVVASDGQLTYAQLDEMSSRLANYLRSAGVGLETPVALYLERSTAFPVAVLGALKAGGAYLPLDTSAPPDRLGYVLTDSQAAVVLTEQRLRPALPDLKLDPGPRIICLDGAEGLAIAEQPATPWADPAVGPEHAAYIIYTSGSTGRPKGVTVEHRQLARYVANVNQWLDLPAGAGYAMVSTVAADLGHTSLFGGLVAGGTLHLLPDEQVGDPDAVADYFARHAIDCLKIVPSHLSALLSGSRPADVLPRKRLVVGGEALSWELVEQIQRLAPGCAILNEYGPTETAVGTIVYQAPAGASASGAAGVPIGTPYPLVTAYALDAHLEPTPVGVPGELYIGGAQGARGYLGRPDLTADRFIPDPFSSAPGARMYRTGDRVRWRADGQLEYLGRGDDQVKIRGFRVELGEVESAIRQHAGVREALVLARQDTPGDLRLVAYVVPMRSDEAQSVVGELQDLLKTQLPHYMLPGAFVPLAALPLTANGKIDRAALPAPDPNAAAHTLYVAPRGAVERVLAAIWAEVLHVERVGVHDNFFELGGHSLLATRVVSRVRKAFGVGLPLRSLMEMATVAQFAELLVANEPKPGHVERVARAHLKLQSMSADEVRQALAHRKRA